MTTLEMDIKIGEVCGFFRAFSSDLNAMHEAEKGLTDAQWDDYSDMLEYTCDTDGWQSMDARERWAKKRAALSSTAAPTGRGEGGT